MANLKVNNYDNLYLRLNRDEYWDFFVNKDAYGAFKLNGLYDNCLISYIDLCDTECTDGSEWIYSKSGYTWDKSLSVGYTLYNISYTGVDNGLFTYRKDRITNKDFFELFQNNKLEVPKNDTRLKLHAVSGNTLQYEYPMEIGECYTKLNGGFFQGFFKTECDKYQVLPSNFEDGDNLYFEFTLKKCDFEPQSDKTLNDKYPENKGIFFYIGTRAENKWIYMYDKEDVDGLEECYQLGVEDFVEGGEIDKKDHIIGNFYEPNPDFEGYDPFELGDYTNYNYYDDNLYADDYCDWNDMYDYLEIESEKKPKIIDENARHSTLTWCCGEINDDDFILKPWFRGCGCPISYKKVPKPKDPFDPNPLKGCVEFGDEYLVDNGELMSVDEAMDYIEAELDISDFEYVTDNGFKLSEANQYYFYTDNKFLFFNRTCTGKTVHNWVEGTQFMYYGRRSKFKGNLFILMNRTKTGYTVHNIDALRDQSANEYNPYNDLYNNALAFRITDNGEIGYRMLTMDCDKEGRDKTSIIEGYSFENVIPDCEWAVVTVRMMFTFGKMKLMFYVNGKLVYITKELPMIDLKALNELYEKQEGVPYNISLGGGTQGLAETILQNYMLNPTRVYPLEKAFAGSFIGYISSFKIYNCFMEHMIINHNYKYEMNKVKDIIT
jgi:hypothetical protein